MNAVLFFYDLVGLGSGLVAVVLVGVLYLKTKLDRLLPLVLANLLVSIVVAILAFDQFEELLNLHDAVRYYAWASIQFWCAGLVAVIPQIGRPKETTQNQRKVERTFIGLAAVAGILWGLSVVWGENSWLFNVAYFSVYGLLTLALVWFCWQSFHRFPATGSAFQHYRKALLRLQRVAGALLPAFLLVDFFGWLIPPVAAMIPKGLSLLPAMLIIMSISMVIAATLELLEPLAPKGELRLNPGMADGWGLTKRETEVLPLLLEFLSYKEIGERLFISPGTARTHVIHIYQKANVSGRLELARRFLPTEAKSTVR